jgi:hypothetical protein
VNDNETPLSAPETGRPEPVEAMQRLLDELAAHIERIEASVRTGQHGPLPRLIKANEATTRRLMEDIGTLLHAVGVAGEPSDVVERVRDLALGRIAAWSSTSPVFYQVRNTRRDDFNNFEIMVRLLENRHAGGDTSAQILDHYYLNMETCNSFRQRFPRIVRLLTDETARRAATSRPVRILNLHTSACHELELLARNRNFVESVQITCLDRDPAALRRNRQRLLRYGTRLQFIKADAREYVAAPSRPQAPYDLIYTLVLFDQVDDEQTIKMIADCREQLAPGGLLLFGNYAPSMPSAERAIIGRLMDWEIRCRSMQGWREIFAQMWGSPDCVRFEPDETHTSQLVLAKLP